MRATRLVAACVVALFAASCKSERGESGSTTEAAAKTKAQGMEGMPGMAVPPTGAKSGGTIPAMVTLNAAQIQHGGVTWSPVTMATASGFAVVPGEVSPNEDRTARLGAPVTITLTTGPPIGPQAR